MPRKSTYTVVLVVPAVGLVLDPLVIFKNKTDQLIKDLVIPKGACVETQEKSWMDEEVMNIYVAKIWLKYVKQKYEKKSMPNFFKNSSQCPCMTHLQLIRLIVSQPK